MKIRAKRKNICFTVHILQKAVTEEVKGKCCKLVTVWTGRDGHCL